MINISDIAPSQKITNRIIALKNRTLLLALLVTLTFSTANADIGYSKAELKALQQREIQAQAPENEPILDLNTLWNNAKQFESEMLATQQEALSPILKQADINDNPNSAARGVIVFASLTMPPAALRQLMMQSSELKVPIVIRGVLPQGFAATVAAIQSLIQTDKDSAINSGMAINPLWFKQLNIQQVPAFAAIKPGACLPKQPCRDSDFDVLYGNISLYDALATLARDGEVPDVAQQVLSRRN
ncbi:type-F conjugative transfer system pilin assembly protein TrbC [Photobacterium frigidiphilum]|uniref:Type-F conjugative transfer system pilin assembly protein TrbC n=1 Tax=Photobacterium frigidiphilum TaxID=264736 RepID=A0A2T3J5X2_9GAMM|nr:type-F conjugative transfer system pilin assembly protein TrbC [Photobacterium frigidiphilum]PSU41896.1 type-F conjugative transfer system pilin assembly protein TrbC [Photobacterium frigidiphilum]